LVLGVTGTGKSYWTQRQVVETSPRVCVWDPHAEYGCETVSPEELEDAPHKLRAASVQLSCVPDWDDPESIVPQFASWVRTCRLHAEGVVLVVDEIVLLEGAAAWLKLLATQSRHWDCPLVLVSQRATSIPKTARAQMSRVVSFLQSDPDDVEALRAVIGEKADQVPKLARHEHIDWHEDERFRRRPGEQQEAAAS
jgi:DNA helicase HerA-like ATPase